MKKISTAEEIMTEILSCLDCISGITEVFGDVFDGATLCFTFDEFTESDIDTLFLNIHNTKRGKKCVIYVHIPFLTLEAAELLTNMLRGKGFRVSLIK